MSSPTGHAVLARASVFGFDPTPLRLTVESRSTAWRATRAAAFVGGGLVLAPVVALAPPHVAWAMGSVLTGGFLGWRKWVERFTLVAVEGDCPKCGDALTLDGATRLRARSTLPCPGCHHDLQVILDEGTPV